MTPDLIELEDFTPGSKHLRFMLEAERKQREYADQRYAYTETYRRNFQQWQREVSRIRARLLGQIMARSQTSPPPSVPAPSASEV